jgi:hypothetical protein
MDPTAVEQLAAAIWPLVATGAAQRVGELGTDEFATHLEKVWARLRKARRERGLENPPGSLQELQDEIRALDGDPEVAQSLQVLINHFHGPVIAPGANFGITNA